MKDEELKEKIKEIVDNPGVSLEKGVKKGFGTVLELGKDVTDTVTTKIKQKEKRKGSHEEHQNTLMMSDKVMK